MRLSRDHYLRTMGYLILVLGILLGFSFHHHLERIRFKLCMRDPGLGPPREIVVFKGGKPCQDSFCAYCMATHRPFLPWRSDTSKWVDQWGTELREQQLEDGKHEKRSAGSDRIFDTEDDQYIRYIYPDDERENPRQDSMPIVGSRKSG